MAVPSPSPDARDKAALRKEALARRRVWRPDPADRAQMEATLAELVMSKLPAGEVVAGYRPLTGEIDPGLLLERLAREGRRIAFPHLGTDGQTMSFRAGPADTPGPFGLLEPAADAPLLKPVIVLVPIVLADRSGVRIGHGKGHYDRALAALPAFTVGIGWDWQITDTSLPADPWDARLSAIATPEEFSLCRS